MAWLLAVAAGVVLVALASACVAVASFRCSAAPSRRDAAVVLGAAVNGRVPSPVFQARIDHAVDLLALGRVRYVVFTGGRAPGDALAEADAAAAYAISRGVRPDRILLEHSSTTTAENIVEAQAVLRAAGLQSVVLVSDPPHLKRAQLLAERQGLDAVPSATPYTRYRKCWPRGLFTLREGYLLLRMWLGLD